MTDRLKKKKIIIIITVLLIIIDIAVLADNMSTPQSFFGRISTLFAGLSFIAAAFTLISLFHLHKREKAAHPNEAP